MYISSKAFDLTLNSMIVSHSVNVNIADRRECLSLPQGPGQFSGNTVDKKNVDFVKILIYLTIFAGKNCFTQFGTIIYENKSQAVSDLFHIFTQSIKLYTFHCHILKSIAV